MGHAIAIAIARRGHDRLALALAAYARPLARRARRGGCRRHGRRRRRAARAPAPARARSAAAAGPFTARPLAQVAVLVPHFDLAAIPELGDVAHARVEVALAGRPPPRAVDLDVHQRGYGHLGPATLALHEHDHVLAMVDGAGSVGAVGPVGVGRLEVVEQDDLGEVEIHHASLHLVAREWLHRGDGTIPSLTPAAKHPGGIREPSAASHEPIVAAAVAHLLDAVAPIAEDREARALGHVGRELAIAPCACNEHLASRALHERARFATEV